MNSRLIALCTGLLFFAGVASAAAQTGVQSSEHHSFRVVTVVEGLENPWSIAFLPGGDMLVTERPGRLRVVRNGALLPEPVSGIPAVRARGQGGLLDVVPHPDFANNRLLYISFSKPNADGSQATTAVIRGRFDGNALTDVQEIFEAKAWSGGGNHFGSRIAFDGRGFVFITVGDRGANPDPSTVEQHPAQDLSNHQGTVIRLHDDGRVPADNPFVNRPGALPEIWSYGHRNLQGLAFHPTTGDLWENEHGPQGGDELNHIRMGLNYGWPIIGFGLQYGGSVIHQGTSRAGLEQPAHYWVPSIATSGLMIYSGDAFPAWKGSAFTGGLAGQQLARVTLIGQRATGVEPLLRGMARIRDVRQGPDGFIYLALDDRRGGMTSIVRLEPAGS
ncbi:MAG: PQQ-dependent sugar dehydrogenase [Gemmatimonadetes bacterium]|nr:PQQ-dependent sugar dehydrogenase [Gemmatimonadota bacterium]